MPSYHARIASLDLETELIAPGNLAPRLVCLQYAGDDMPHGIVVPSSSPQRIDNHARFSLERARDGVAGLCGSNIAFDMGVLYEHLPRLQELIWETYDAGGIWELGTWQRLIQISRGDQQEGVSLDDLCRKYSYVLPVSKGDDTRMTYSQYLGRPLDEYSAKHRTYALHDALAGRHVGSALLALTGKAGVTIACLQDESRYHWAMHLISAWGMRIDPARTEQLANGAIAEEARLRAYAIDAGYMRVNGVKDTAAIGRAVEIAYRRRLLRALPAAPTVDFDTGISTGDGVYTVLSVNGDEIPATPKQIWEAHDPTPRTPTGKPSISGETLEESGDPTLEALAEWGHWRKVVTSDLKMLNQGILNTRYGLANSTRTTSSKPPVQNWPKKGGMRECVVPSKGHAFLSADVKGLESATCAQVLINEWDYRDLANRINSGVDPLIEFAAEYSGRSYADISAGVDAGDETCKQLRQIAKGPIYGLPGGMGAARLQAYLKKAGVEVSADEAQHLKRTWERLYPQTKAAHRHISDRLRDHRTDTYRYRIHGSHGLHRGGATFSAACNGLLLQSLGAQMMKWIAYQVVRAQHIGDMQGSHANIFEHDALVLDTPLDALDHHAERLEHYFQLGFAKYCPDVRMSTEVTCSDRWSKQAKRIVNSKGQLQVYRIS